MQLALMYWVRHVLWKDAGGQTRHQLLDAILVAQAGDVLLHIKHNLVKSSADKPCGLVLLVLGLTESCDMGANMDSTKVLHEGSPACAGMHA